MNSLEPMTLWMFTGDTSLLGTSMPTMEIWSGMGAMRTPEAPRARAMSSARLVSLFSRTPWSSSSSYRVTEGPRVTLTMLASMPKEWMVSSSRCRLALSSTRASPPMSPGPSFSRGEGRILIGVLPRLRHPGLDIPGHLLGSLACLLPGDLGRLRLPGALPGEGGGRRGGRDRRDRRDRRGGRLRRLPDQLRLGGLCRRLRRRGGLLRRPLLRPRQHLVRSGDICLAVEKAPLLFHLGSGLGRLAHQGAVLHRDVDVRPAGGGPNGLRGGRPLLPLAPARALRLLLRLILIARAGRRSSPPPRPGRGGRPPVPPAGRPARTGWWSPGG